MKATAATAAIATGMRPVAEGVIERCGRARVTAPLVAAALIGVSCHVMGQSMTHDQVEKFARLALAGIDREFPNKPGNVMRDAGDVKSPKSLHPVFYGNFDWHSSLHGHWMLLRLLTRFPDAPVSAEVRDVLDRRLTEGGLRAEADYFEPKENRSFERMYGWGWALRFAVELRGFDGPGGARWAEHYRPLEDVIVRLAKDYLPKLDWPVRCGFHPETGFPLGQMLDYSRAVGDGELERLVLKKARAFYLEDKDYPASYEPSGTDFFSSGLNEADLMRRVLDGDAFASWLEGFFPGLAEGRCGNLLVPVSVSDVTDGHLVHLAGLNLNRAWTMRAIAAALPAPGDPRKKVLETAAAAHEKAGLGYVFSGHYEGEHWLASFAVYLLTGVGLPGA